MENPEDRICCVCRKLKGRRVEGFYRILYACFYNPTGGEAWVHGICWHTLRERVQSDLEEERRQKQLAVPTNAA